MHDGFKTELEQIQSNTVRSKFSDVSKNDLSSRGIIVFGGGLHGQQVVSGLLSQGITPAWVVDKNPALAGQSLYGVPIRPLSSLREIGESYVLLASSHVQSMLKDCAEYGVTTWILPSAIRNIFHIACDLGYMPEIGEKYNDKIIATYSLLGDQQSKVLFKDYLKFHYSFDTTLFSHFHPQIYFHPDLAPRIDYSHFVDGGAFIGDTLESWNDYYKPYSKTDPYAYYAFEPCHEQFNELTKFVKKLPQEVKKNIVLEQSALGSSAGELPMSGSGMWAWISDDSSAHKAQPYVPIKTLDEFIATHKPPTAIKADVEGFELPMLEGAKNTILDYRPALLFSAYHKFSDIWEIPLWIHSLNRGYKLYLRHHNKLFADTVCYALPS